VLGPLEVHDQGEVIRLGGRRQRLVLAVLLTNANEVVSTDRLIDDVWGITHRLQPANPLKRRDRLQPLVRKGFWRTCCARVAPDRAGAIPKTL
jgi:hypothetical protein